MSNYAIKGVSSKHLNYEDILRTTVNKVTIPLTNELVRDALSGYLSVNEGLSLAKAAEELIITGGAMALEDVRHKFGKDLALLETRKFLQSEMRLWLREMAERLNNVNTER